MNNYRLVLALLTLLVLTPLSSQARTARGFDYCGVDKPLCPFGNFEVPLPVDAFQGNICCVVQNFSGSSDDEIAPIRGFVGVLANIFVAAIVGIALIMIVIGGFIYMTAGGTADRIQMAKKIIGSAILGMILALLTFVILYTVNPAITGEPPPPPPPGGYGAAGGATGESRLITGMLPP